MTYAKVTPCDRRDWLCLMCPWCPRDSDCLAHDFTHIVQTSRSKRSEPSSRAFLIGEQPNPWELLHPQDKTSRHRGAELRRRYELLGGTSLLSLE